MATLSSLPPELVCMIIDFLEPSAHLNFALTSKSFAYLSRGELKYHRHHHEENSSTDVSIHNQTVYDWIHFLAAEPIPAWHVRELDIFSVGGKDAPWALEPDAVANVDRLLQERLWSKLPAGPALDEARRDLESGTVAGRQFVLITALCSRLRSLQLDAAALQDIYPEDWLDLKAETPIHEFCTFLFSLSRIQRSLSGRCVLPSRGEMTFDFSSRLKGIEIWPLGLKSLRKVAIYPTDIYYQWFGEDRPLQLKSLLSIFLLPSISTIEIRAEGPWTEDPHERSTCQAFFRDPQWASCSTVKHLILGRVGGGEYFLTQMFILAKSLETVILDDTNVGPGYDKALDVLHSDHPSLDRFITRGTSPLEIRESDMDQRIRLDTLFNLPRPRVFTINVADIMPWTNRVYSAPLYRPLRKNIPIHLEDALELIPPTVEVLLVSDPCHKYGPADMRHFSDFLITLVKQKRLPKLKAVYADEFETKVWRRWASRPGDDSASGWLSEAQSYLGEHGVRLYTQDDPGATKEYVESVIDELE